MKRASRKLIRLLENDGWQHVATTGSHHHFKHSVKDGKITVPHPKRDQPIAPFGKSIGRLGILRNE